MPRVVVDDEDVSSGAALVLAAHHADAVEVSDGTRHRGGETPRATPISAAVILPSSSMRSAEKIRDGSRARPAEVRAPPIRSTKLARSASVAMLTYY